MQGCSNFIIALRGFHAYHNTVNLNPCIEQKYNFKREFYNKHGRFAVGGRAMLPGKVAPVVVGHVPKELSRHI